MRFASIFLLAALSAPGQTSSATIQGTVLDAKTSKPIPVAYVFANRAGAPPVTKHTKSGADGAFQIQELTAGTYSLCVQAPNDQFLDPCSWNGSPTVVTLASGQNLSGVSVKLTAASILSIQVQDPQAALAQTTKDGRHPDLTLGVWEAQGSFHPAHVAGPAPGFRASTSSAPIPPAAAHNTGTVTFSYQLAVPRDVTLNFYAASHDLKLGDAVGAALVGNVSLQAFQHVTGDSNPKSFAFQILGLLP